MPGVTPNTVVTIKKVSKHTSLYIKEGWNIYCLLNSLSAKSSLGQLDTVTGSTAIPMQGPMA